MVVVAVAGLVLNQAARRSERDTDLYFNAVTYRARSATCARIVAEGRYSAVAQFPFWRRYATALWKRAASRPNGPATTSRRSRPPTT